MKRAGVFLLFALALTAAAAQEPETVAWRNGAWFDGTGFQRVDVYSIGDRLTLKHPSKVDRSSAYFCRYVARQVVANGFAKKAEIQVGYAIGMAKPVSVKVDTFGTGDEDKAAKYVMESFDFRPRAIIETLNLLRPIYRKTTNYGHFGRTGLPWEEPVAVAAK